MHNPLTTPFPSDENTRVETLHEYDILDSENEQAFDDLAALASFICETPISAISFVDSDRQWFKASVGIEEKQTARNISFCQHTVLEETILEVPDASQDSRFKDSPLVTDGPKVQFYAGVPLVAPNGSAVGALCVKDTKPRHLTESQKDALQRLARQVMGQLELRKVNSSLQEQALLMASHAEDMNQATHSAVMSQMEAQDALQSLTESEERFRAFAENASDAFFMRDEEGHILYVNRAACEMLGYTEEELLARTIADIVVPRENDPEFKTLLTPEHGHTSTSNAQHRRKNGETFFVEVKVSRFDLRGSPMFFAIARDQTEQLMAIEAMKKGEERFDLVCCATNDVVWDLDLLTGNIWSSPNYVSAFGTESADTHSTLEKRVESIHPEDRQRISDEFDLALKSGASSWQGEYRYATANGAYAEVLDRAFLIFDPNGAPIRAIGAMADHTEKRQAEKDREEREQAEQANQAKSQFLSRMSHELRTPLNSILGFAQLLEMYQPTDQQMECIGRILSGGKHLLSLINEVLDLSRIESGNMEISQEPVCVQYVVDEAISLTSPLARGRGVTVQKTADSDPTLFAMADRQRLLQIVINLITNGVKYNSDGGFVNIGFSAGPDDSVKIVVQDTGKGIGKELAHRVFMPFDRLGIEQSEQIEGTGLGLTLSKSLVEAMNGHISFTSEVGVGTIFHVELMRTSEPEIEVEDLAIHTPKPLNPGRMRLLYIEDNESNIALMRSLVAARSQWELSVAVTGGEGLQMIAANPPNLLLLDLDLPDTSGYEVLIRLRADHSLSDLPILIVSADATHDRIERLLEAGANGYVTKPFDVRDLLNRITSHLHSETEHAA